MLPVVVASRAQRSVPGGHGALVAQVPAYLCACCGLALHLPVSGRQPLCELIALACYDEDARRVSSDGLIFLSVPERSVSMACRV